MLDFLYSLWHTFWAIPHIRSWLLIGWAAYLALLGIIIALQKREPVATLSWLVSLAALPYLGFLIYQIFGPQKIQRQTLRRQRHRARLNQAIANDTSAQAKELSLLAQATSGLPPSSARQARWLVDGAATYAALINDIGRAECHIHLEYYIYASDHSGTAIRDALIERARAGVKVRLLLDAVGSARVKRGFFQPLLDAGGELAWFHPARFGRIWTRTWVNLRTHRKVVVIDGRIGFIGGINITDEQNEQRNPAAYRDLHMRVEGDVVRAFQTVFVEDWAYATGSTSFLGEVAKQTPVAPEPGPIRMQMLVSGPDSPWEAIHRLHVAAIHAAYTRVWLVTPYFVPGEAARMALTSAAQSGLDVRVLVPKVSDSRLVTYAARSYFDELLAAGVKVYEYGPRMLHTKALLVDDSTAIIGSANFDQRSFRLNFESSLLIEDTPLVTELAELIESELRCAPRVRADRDHGLFKVRLPEAIARLLSPLL